MFPILYEQITAGTVPQHYGLGVLSDCQSCECEQIRNDKYEISFVYPMFGAHAQDIAVRRVIKIKPNPTDNPQLFRIKRVGKVMDGKFTVYCRHISYDLSGCEITSGTANNAASACVLLQSAASGYTIHTNKEVTADFAINTPGSVRSYFAGREGSFLDVYGTAEIKYDNFDVNFMLHAGQDRGVTIKYGKNLLELSQEIDCENLYTHVLCYYKNGDEPAVTGDKVATGLTLDVPNTLIVDMTSEFEETPTVADLTAKATAYIGSHNLTTPTNNVKLDFVQSGDLVDRVDLCDTVNVYYEALGITRTAMKCIRTKYDCLRERYIEVELGDAKKSLADTIADTSGELDSVKSATDTAETLAKSKRRVFVVQPVPPYDVGDLWTDGDILYYCATAKTSAESFDSEDWALATDYIDQSSLEIAITRNTEIITGGTGGYAIWHTDSDGRPYETLYMNTPDITTATRVLRINDKGIGLSTTGYEGPYVTAITADGINASSIVTGILDASRVTIQHLTATMIQGGKLTLGGDGNAAGIFELKNDQGIVIGKMDKDGLKFFGEGAEGARPYVLLNNRVGFAGYDANDVEIFKVSRDSFVMKKCVAKEEITACDKVRFIPITLSNNGVVVNDGIALVALPSTGA